MDLSETERAAMTAVLTAAINYADPIEYAALLIEAGEGRLSPVDEAEYIEEDAKCAHALVEAVKAYRKLNDSRREHGVRNTGN